jgi:transcriptional regulator with XRE-family HTH domain
MTSIVTHLKIAKKLKVVRIAKQLTQLELSEKAGISANYYAKVERGEATPSLDTFAKIIKALGVKSSDILPF